MEMPVKCKDCKYFKRDKNTASRAIKEAGLVKYFHSRYMARCYAEHNKIEDYTILRKQKEGIFVFILYTPYENVSRETLRKAGKHE